jgi:hypothetical protein
LAEDFCAAIFSTCCSYLKKYEEAVLLNPQYITPQFISVISRAVFMVKIAIIDKEMHSHMLSAMADNYPVDWCIYQKR